jgi:hypothetical protein
VSEHAYSAVAEYVSFDWIRKEIPGRRASQQRHACGASNKGRGTGLSEFPTFRHPVKGGMALERPHAGRKEAEADRAAAVAVVEAVDQRREFLAPLVVGGEEIRLMLRGGNQIQQHDADAERLGARYPLPELLEAGEQEAGVVRFEEGDFIPPAAEIADP